MVEPQSSKLTTTGSIPSFRSISVPDAWVLCTLIISATVLIMYFGR